MGEFIILYTDICNGNAFAMANQEMGQAATELYWKKNYIPSLIIFLMNGMSWSVLRFW